MRLYGLDPQHHTQPFNSSEKEGKIYKNASEAVWSRSPAPHTAVISRKKIAKGISAPMGLYGLDPQRRHTAVNSREKESKIYKSASEAVWARSPAPHTAVISREKDSKRQKRAFETVWARSPAPHTAVNSIGREERRKRESSFVTVLYSQSLLFLMARFVFIATAFMQSLYSKIFIATIIVIIIITTTKIEQFNSRREEERERGESDYLSMRGQ